jgi:hypothetical protein
LVSAKVRKEDMDPWIDTDYIDVGEDILEKVGDALKTTDLFVLLVSAVALESGWVDRELKFIARRQIKEKRVLIMPFIIDETPVDSLPWFLTTLNVQTVRPDEVGATVVASAVRRALGRRSVLPAPKSSPQNRFKGDPRIDRLINGVRFLDQEAAAAAAIEIVKTTGPSGQNELFEALLNYQDYPGDQEFLMRALSIIERCAELAPWLFDHEVLSRMAAHPDFSVRSSAASICMDFVQFAPDRAPVDILIKLAVYDEDWYVQAPANAALKAMARALPAVLRIFFMRLHSPDAEERNHAASALLGIAAEEPEILEPEELQRELSRLKRIGDKDAVRDIERALPKVQRARRVSRYKYGI